MVSKKSQEPQSLPTLADVARVANVSTATVSRYLNGNEVLRPATAKRVSAAIDSLGYLPHGAARALASRQSFTLGAILPALNNQIFAAAAQAMQERLDSEGYTLLIANSDYSIEREFKQLQSLIQRGLDGVLLVGQSHSKALYHLLAQQQIPYLNSWVFDPHSPHPTLGFDNAEGARKITRYLLDLGHRRIGMIAGLQQSNDRAAARVTGVREALQERGLALLPAQLREAPYTITGGRQAFADLYHTSADLTAIVCGNDILAMGAIFECQRLGLEVPGDISITGYDDIDIVADMTPRLTTIHVPAEKIGQRAAEDLLQQISGEAARHSIYLDAELMVRDSCAPISDRAEGK
jgi:LacI family transcriptional regulator